MLQIVGFGQMLRFDHGMTPVTEMQVQDATGKVHNIEVTQEIVEKLVSVWVGAGRTKSEPVVAAPARIVDDAVVEDSQPDLGEVVGPSIVQEVPPPAVESSELGYPKRQVRTLPSPAFMERTPPDEDGDQI